MKTYKIKNYKGNLLESIKKFQTKHADMRIVEACEDGGELKIKAENNEFYKPYEADKVLESTTIQNVKWAPFDPEKDDVEKDIIYLGIDKNTKQTVIFRGLSGTKLMDVEIIAKDIS